MSSSSKPKPRTNTGRKKVKIEKIQNKSNLHVTFSKRRSGVMKKASELGTLCRAEVAIIMKCPRGKKVYSFGHPTIKQVFDKYVFGIPPAQTAGTVDQIIDVHRSSKIRELNLELTQAQAMLCQEKNRAEALAHAKIEGQIEKWYRPSLEDFSLEELLSYKAIIENFEQHIVEEFKAPVNNLGADQSSLPAYGPSLQYDENIHGASTCSFFNYDPSSNPLPVEFDFDDFSAGIARPAQHETVNYNLKNDVNHNGSSELYSEFNVPNTYGTMNPSLEPSSTILNILEGSYSSWRSQSPLPPTHSVTHWTSGLGPYTGFNDYMASGFDLYAGFNDSTGGSAPYIGFGMVGDSVPYSGHGDAPTSVLGPHCGLNDGTGFGPSGGFHDGPRGSGY